MGDSFSSSCEYAHNVVQSFLSSLSAGHLQKSPLRPIFQKYPYPYDPQIRAQTQNSVRESLSRIKHSIESHGLSSIAISYNGGKDCLVMLVLVLAAVHDTRSHELGLSLLNDTYAIDSIFIDSDKPFSELRSFIQDSNKFFKTNYVTIEKSLKEGFRYYLSEINQSIKYIIIGVRSFDPYCSGLAIEQETDSDWPSFTRLHPILDWTYSQVWDFIIGCSLDYCCLYDHGYTSLGGMDNTIPNRFLKNLTSDTFRPAYMLREMADVREREGRLPKAA